MWKGPFNIHMKYKESENTFLPSDVFHTKSRTILDING